MAIVTSKAIRPSYGYPTRDGKPMAETELHGKITIELMLTLEHHFRDDPKVYVWGDLLLFYEEGNKLRHVSPDVFFVRGVPKGLRDNYLTWIEGKGPDVVFEVSSWSTRQADAHGKFELYRDTLQVPEYFLFDPLGEYLIPRFQGYRLEGGEYVPIEPVDGRLPSVELRLHLVEMGKSLRIWDPATGSLLLTGPEQTAEAKEEARQARKATRQARKEARQSDDRAQQADDRAQQADDRAQQADDRAQQADDRAQQADDRAQQADDRAQQADDRAHRAEEEVARLRRELEKLRHHNPPKNGNA